MLIFSNMSGVWWHGVELNRSNVRIMLDIVVNNNHITVAGLVDAGEQRAVH